MWFMPFQVLGVWLRGLLSLVLIGAGIGLLSYWYTHRETVVTEPAPVADARPAADEQPAANAAPPAVAERTRVVRWEFGANRETACLLGGLALLAWSFGGGWLVNPRFLRRRGADEPTSDDAGTTQRLRGPSGAELNVRIDGPADGPPVVLVHGWGLDRHEWCYARRELGRTCRLIVWDLPGLGASSRPPDRDWSLDKLAGDLDAVVGLAGGRPVVLLGHSIGGMIVLTYCRRFPQALGPRVRGLVLAHTTYTNPVRTTRMAGLYTALQKPVLEPLCHLMVWLSPVVRVLTWLSYLNGSAHRSTERDSFSGRETRGQLDFITRYYCQAAPDVIARGMLAMFRYDATDVLPAIAVPTLVVAGERDTTCTPEASRFIADTVPGAQLVTLPQDKHCGLFEDHGQFNALVAEFAATGAVPPAGAAVGPGHSPTPAARSTR